MAAKSKTSAEVAKKLVENLNTDLRTLSSECRRKYPPVKEVSFIFRRKACTFPMDRSRERE